MCAAAFGIRIGDGCAEGEESIFASGRLENSGGICRMEIGFFVG